MLNWLGDWWNAVELWLTQLWFPFQFALVMAVLMPICLAAAWLIDRLIDKVSTWFSHPREEDPPIEDGAERPGEPGGRSSGGTNTAGGTSTAGGHGAGST